MKATFKRTMLAASCAAALGGINTTVQAADWLALQGTEPQGTAARAKVWGFIQAQYQDDTSDPGTGPNAGLYVPPKLIGPDLDTQSAFNINRARVGVRGTGMPIDPNVNYFFLVEFGNNAITNPGSSFAKVTDASITLNHLKDFVRARAGQFKIPMAEEIYQGIALFDYVNFTAGTNQLLLERIPNRTYTGNVPAQPLPPGTSLNAYNQSVAAARGIGLQLFNTVHVAPTWEVGYSFMVDNGNGINTSDNDDNKDIHLYLNATKVFSGRGPRRQDWKTFAWYTKGDRTIDGTNDSIHNPQEYERKRYGVGTKYYQLPFRVSAEWIKAEGVIFQGPDKPSFGLLGPGVGNPNHSFNGLNPDAEATSWYIEGGYYIPNTKWEIDLRYAKFNRMDNQSPVSFGPPAGPHQNVTPEVEFTELTLGVQYHFNRKTRLTLNLSKNEAEAVTYAAGAAPNSNLDGVDNRYAIQLTHIF